MSLVSKTDSFHLLIVQINHFDCWLSIYLVPRVTCSINIPQLCEDQNPLTVSMTLPPFVILTLPLILLNNAGAPLTSTCIIDLVNGVSFGPSQETQLD
jgi:hypothetical protein